MKMSEIRELTTAELIERLESERKQLLKLKISHAINPIENPMKIRLCRKIIARILTELNNRKNKEKQQKQK